MLAAIPTLFGAIVVVFFVVQLIPGDPVRVMLGENASAGEVEEVRTALGLNDPLPVQFLRFAGRYATGDLGVSIFSRQPVAGEIAQRLAPTVQLAPGGVLVAIVLGVPMGVSRRRAAARSWTICASAPPRSASPCPTSSSASCSPSPSPPLGWFPTLERDGRILGTQRAVLPAHTPSRLPAWRGGAHGAGDDQALGEDYVRTANAIAVAAARRLLARLRNAAIPIADRRSELRPPARRHGRSSRTARPGLGKLLLDALLARATRSSRACASSSRCCSSSST